ncbi:MAG: DUF2764 family protein [Bacteroidales bacterium]|nr:DUF2764 family protein [Candidatus Cryptobacteroides fimicaballi]
MSNYEYIIAGLPVLQRTADGIPAGFDAEELIAGIRSALEGKDAAGLDLLLQGFDPDSLNADFYAAALKNRSDFIRKYFEYDLLVRNTRTVWLNRSLGRDELTDTVTLPGMEDPDPFEVQAINEVLSRSDILERERELDTLMWNRIEEINVMKVFDLDVILGFTACLKIVDRWLKLDPETGRGLFRKLVEEIRSSRTKTTE